MKLLKIESEAEIAEVAKVFLELNNWELYSEVVIDLFNGRPDYIGVKNKSLCQVIECKKTLSYPVIEQLSRWQIDAEKRREWIRAGSDARVAIPHLLTAFVARTSGGVSGLKCHILSQFRIGVYSIEKRENMRTRDRRTNPYFETCSDQFWNLVWGEHEYNIREEIAPKIQVGSRRTAHQIIESLRDDMKNVKAGVTAGQTDYMTPFKRTMNRVEMLMADGKERHIQHIINEIKPLGGHHYLNDKVAMARIAHFIDKFEMANRTRKHGAWFAVEKL